MSLVAARRTTFIEDRSRTSIAGALRAELVKLVTLRSSVGLLVAIVALGLAVSLALGITLEDAGLPSAASAAFVLDQVTVGTVLFGQLVAGVLGALAIAGEHASGTIRTTLVAVPSRSAVLAAKAAVVFASTFAAALLALVASWATTFPLFAAHGIEIGLGAPGVVPALLGAATYVGLCGVLGLGVGALLRSIAASVAAVLTLILLLPIVLSVLPVSPAVRALHLLTMSKAGDALAGLPDAGAGLLALGEGYVSPVAGLGIALAWASALLLAGAVRLHRSDV